MSDDLLKLAARCEAATGPDREIDAAIAATARHGTEHTWAYGYPAWLAASDGRVHLAKNGPSFAAPAYTASLDAAMTLRPKGWDWQYSSATGTARVWLGDGRVHNSTGNAATPELALCAAALRAKAVQ